MDQQYRNLSRQLVTREHRYGERVFLISQAFLLSRLARLCSPECVQPETNQLIRDIYRGMGQMVAHHVFPRSAVEIPTRMAEQHPKEGKYAGEVIDPKTQVVLIDLARAGILPAMELFDLYTSVLDSGSVRVDHVFINRSVDENKKVTGAPIHGSKIGGPIDGTYAIVPDPMGATGSSICNVIDLYKRKVSGKPKEWISMNLIITPEYVKKVTSTHPEVKIFALRLDRGFSSPRALQSVPGTYPGEEKGLNDIDYIVPGGGGFGEISNNSYV